jgi:hypothetical protein
MAARYVNQMTPELASAAGLDAGNSRMRKAGRIKWNEEDWNRACEVFYQCVGRDRSRLCSAVLEKAKAARKKDQS